MVSVGFIAPGGSLSLSAPLGEFFLFCSTRVLFAYMNRCHNSWAGFETFSGEIYISHIVVSQASQKVPLKKYLHTFSVICHILCI